MRGGVVKLPDTLTLQAVCRLYASNGGWPLTVREVQAELGVPSTHTTHSALKRLLARGYVEQRSSTSGYRPAGG